MEAKPVKNRISLLRKLDSEKNHEDGTAQHQPAKGNNEPICATSVTACITASPYRRVGLVELDRNAPSEGCLREKKVTSTTKIELETKPSGPKGDDDLLSIDSQLHVDMRTFLPVEVIRRLPDPESRLPKLESLCLDYVKDMMTHLYQQELKTPVLHSPLMNQKDLRLSDRHLVLDWLVRTHGTFRLVPETLFHAVYILDAYCHQTSIKSFSCYQLFALTSLIIAWKLEEVCPPCMWQVVDMCKIDFGHWDVLRTERDILRSLKFDVNCRPTAVTFLRRYSLLAEVDHRVHCMAKFLIELALLEYDLIAVRPSKIAAAALFLAMKLDSITDLDALVDDPTVGWTAFLAYNTNYPTEILLPLVYELCALLSKKRPRRERFVWRKYGSNKLYNVSEDPMLRSSFVYQWASHAKVVTSRGSKTACLQTSSPQPPAKKTAASKRALNTTVYECSDDPQATVSKCPRMA